jgi:hypothetical protein
VTAQLRGLDLLDAAIDHIEKHPETWEPAAYRCTTGMCLAGWIAEQPGGEWAGAPGYLDEEYLVREPEDDPDDIEEEGVHAAERAERLIGRSRCIDGGWPNDLFAGSNTLDDIKAMRDVLRAGSQ